MKTWHLKTAIATMVALLGFTNFTFSQTLTWQQHYTTNTNTDDANDVHVGGDGRIYVGGFLGSSTVGDALTLSYTNSGTLNWFKTYS